jgi:TetR/AcrR family transcriptional regulator, regulator of cefoperazone and chloramphenicol sensitivity
MKQQRRRSSAISPRTRSRDRSHEGSPRGQKTRERILDAALKAFAEASFAEATTRQIAESAAVSLPTLQYYFEDKEGLYRACAETILERYRQHAGSAGAAAREALENDCSPEQARVQLKALMSALGRFLLASSEVGRWARFVSRELRDPGPAFEILYAGLWHPGVEVTTRLIARVMAVSADDPRARIRALLLISSLTAFQSGRTIAMRTMRWSSLGAGEVEMVLSCVDAQIDEID